MIVIVGFGNAVNLTDGLDGLAIVPVMIAAGTFGVICYLVGRVDYSRLSRYSARRGRGRTRRPFWARCSAPRSASSGTTRRPRACSWAIPVHLRSAVCSARLPWRPSTRSCSRSSAVCSCSKRLSVMLQVVVFKRTGKRVFLMAHPPPFRKARLARADNRDPLLDHFGDFRARRPRDIEVALTVRSSANPLLRRTARRSDDPDYGILRAATLRCSAWRARVSQPRAR